MLRIVADNFVLSEKKEEFLIYAEKLVEGTRKEEGNISYCLHQDKEDENHLTFIEEWKDEDAVRKHNASDHFVRLVPLMAACCEKNGTCYVYEILF